MQFRAFHPITHNTSSTLASSQSRSILPSHIDLRVLLLDIMFRATLLSLANIVLILCLELRLTIASDTGHSPSYGSADAVCNTGTIVVELTCSLLALALRVLLLTRVLKRLGRKIVSI